MIYRVAYMPKSNFKNRLSCRHIQQRRPPLSILPVYFVVEPNPFVTPPAHSNTLLKARRVVYTAWQPSCYLIGVQRVHLTTHGVTQQSLGAFDLPAAVCSNTYTTQKLMPFPFISVACTVTSLICHQPCALLGLSQAWQACIWHICCVYIR